MAEPPASSRRPLLALPPEPTPFVGRADDVARVTRMLGEARLVTLTGPPGIGKTRTALRVAMDSTLPAWFCDLSTANSIGDVCTIVARTFGVSLGDGAVETLGARFARLDACLLVLDNFERLVDIASTAVTHWLERAPALRVLVTSRERLRLREEHVAELASLSLPRRDDAGDAVRLFVARARAHQPELTLSADEEAKLAAVVVALEGNPLAIELAAARIDALGLDALHDRISAQLQLLNRGARGDQRQGTLHAAIDASWQLLDAEQRRALARLAVFRAGFTLAAAESVIGAAALDRIQDLRDRSLLRSPHGGRFALYESIREFARAQLETSGDRQGAIEAHRDYFLAMAAEHAHRFAHDGGPIDTLAADYDNLLAVFERALEAGDRTSAAQAVLHLGPILSTRGPARFHLELLNRLEDDVTHVADLLHARGLAKRTVGDLEGAEADLLDALEAAPEGWLYACIRKDLGVLYHQRRRIDQARACYESALLQARALGDRRLDGVITGNLGALAHDIGRFEEATRHYREALDRLREVKDARLEGIFWTNYGVLEQEEGRAPRARKHYERALALFEGAVDSRFEAIALGNLGLLEHEAGNHDAAKARHEQALELLLEVGDTRSEAWCRARLGAVLADLGDLQSAETQLDEAERLVVGRDALGLALTRLHRCFLELASGDQDAALARIEAAQTPQDDSPSLAEVNDDARMLLRMLAKSMTRGDGPRLEVGPQALWFRAPGGPRRSLEKYGAARNILERLTVARLTGGAALSADELFEAGWPGVTIAQQSANNRLYVALAKLRKMGLKVLLLRTEDGYELDPHTPVLRADD